MCRFLAYIGTPIIIDELLVKPVNSLINQSYDAEEMSQTLNGDGFGLGWYNKEVRSNPGLFRAITPAWNNQNLLYNASLIRTGCLFAHIRAASEGGITEYNCHPFHYKEYLMMHNGGIDSFMAIKRELLNALSDHYFHWIQGQTDTEHIFALLMQNLSEMKNGDAHLSTEQVAAGFKKTFEQIEQFKKNAGIGDEISAYNMMITDGERVFGTRYSTKPEEITPTLYYSTGSRFMAYEGVSRMLQEKNTDEKAVLIVSEKLTEIEEDWQAIPPNYFIGVDANKRIELLPL